MTCKGEENAEDVSVDDIERVRVQYFPSTWMMKQLDLKNLTFGRAGTVE